MSKPPKPSLKSIVAATAPVPPPVPAKVIRLQAVPEAPARPSRGTLKERAKQLSVYLEPQVYDQLRDIAHCERTKIHTLMLEALDLLFHSRGAQSRAELEARSQD